MCLFCKIVRKEIPAKIIFEDDDTVVFHDINPVAPVHVLVIPKVHLVALSDAGSDQVQLLGKLLDVAKNMAETLKIAKSGYRTVINSGADGGQSVFHLHVHVIGGRPMAWPPG